MSMVPEIVNRAVDGAISHRRTLIGLLVVAPTMAAGLWLVCTSEFEAAFKVFMAMMVPAGTVIGYLFGRQSARNGNDEGVD